MNQIEIKISVDTGKTLPLSYLHALQGNLKDLSEASAIKLKNSILKHGFAFPIFVWDNPEDGDFYVIDGHQRIFVLERMKNEGYLIPQLPVVMITANNINEAKEKLLVVASQYGQFNQVGFDEFISSIQGLDMPEIMNQIEMPILKMPAVDYETTIVKEHERNLDGTANKEIKDKDQWIILISCENEIDQQQKFQQISEMGIQCQLI